MAFDHDTTGDEVVAKFADRVKGKTFLLTGPTLEGVGGATLLALAKGSPSAFILVGRSESKIRAVIDAVLQIDPHITAIYALADFTSLATIRSAASIILSNPSVGTIDVFINNAGVMATPFSKTVDGIETQFATNHIAPFLLTNLLRGKLSKGATIVSISSSAHKMSTGDYDDYNYERTPYHPFGAYGQSKLATVLFTTSLVQRGYRAITLHPGLIFSGMQRHVTREQLAENARAAKERDPSYEGPGAPKTLAQGCSTTLVAALDPSIPNGAYLFDCRVAEPKKEGLDTERAEKLWVLSEKLVGQKFD
ncbi:retinol dehydrogenase [Auricularia subglabra TFB-10046 SS5]|nr:retinol dehydrogenase [Auricularia subglabra TFB-10046 SS5]